MANWLMHGVTTPNKADAVQRRTTAKVDAQDASGQLYRPTRKREKECGAFQTVRALVLEGLALSHGNFRAAAASFPRSGQGGSGRMRMRLLLALILAAVPDMVGAQTSLIHRQPLETADFPGNGLHTVVMRTTIDPAGVVAPHLHAGLEMAYVAAGTVTVTIGDAPAREVAAGGSFQVAPRTRHSVRNSGSGRAVVVSTYIVDLAAPLVTPAP
jgi:quercetin dioxygenase-like cupin family protein